VPLQNSNAASFYRKLVVGEATQRSSGDVAKSAKPDLDLPATSLSRALLPFAIFHRYIAA
jgi:hypothetical protein